MSSTAWGGYKNGEIPLDKMVVVRGEHFEPEAAAHLLLLEADFTGSFRKPAIIIEGFRSLATEQYLWDGWQAGKPGFNPAWPPGQSNHGFGRAADFGSNIDRFGTPEHDWMVANAPKYGWHWGEATSEAWHFTYYPGTATAAVSSTPITNTTTPTPATGWKKEDENMHLCHVDEKVVDVPGEAGVRSATWKNQRTYLQYSDSFYLEFTASDETASAIATQCGGPSAGVSRSFFDAVKRAQK